MDAGVSDAGFWWIIGAMFAAIGAAFGWGQKSIGDAKKELRGEMSDIRSELRQDRKDANAYRESILTRLGEVPTREDLRNELKDHEDRILRLLEGRAVPRH